MGKGEGDGELNLYCRPWGQRPWGQRSWGTGNLIHTAELSRLSSVFGRVLFFVYIAERMKSLILHLEDNRISPFNLGFKKVKNRAKKACNGRAVW